MLIFVLLGTTDGSVIFTVATRVISVSYALSRLNKLPVFPRKWWGRGLQPSSFTLMWPRLLYLLSACYSSRHIHHMSRMSGEISGLVDMWQIIYKSCAITMACIVCMYSIHHGINGMLCFFFVILLFACTMCLNLLQFLAGHLVYKLKKNNKIKLIVCRLSQFYLKVECMSFKKTARSLACCTPPK